jgi:hypothetical protein
MYLKAWHAASVMKTEIIPKRFGINLYAALGIKQNLKFLLTDEIFLTFFCNVC